MSRKIVAIGGGENGRFSKFKGNIFLPRQFLL